MAPRGAVSRGNAAGAEIESDGILAGLSSKWHRAHRMLNVAAALAALESEGFALRGHFTPGAEAEEWCEPRLLARIDRYTVKRLRAETEPIALRDLSSRAGRWSRRGPDQ
jgi:hypothetical protein